MEARSIFLITLIIILICGGYLIITNYLSHSPALLDKNNCIDLLEYGVITFIVLYLIQIRKAKKHN
ncbi:hypothetical protein HMPREF3215_00646 [Staphylococcus simulans]|nr:hypothetical protein HMPREF3215_00646 [Staphylococcus simulans]